MRRRRAAAALTRAPAPAAVTTMPAAMGVKPDLGRKVIEASGARADEVLPRAEVILALTGSSRVAHISH